jgi:hypothetical protein
MGPDRVAVEGTGKLREVGPADGSDSREVTKDL